MKLNALSVAQLRRAASLKERIETLETELASLLGGTSAAGAGTADVRAAQAGKRGMSPAARAKISAAQKARRAERKDEAGAAPASRSKATPKRTMNDAARARLSAIAKARWARTKAAGKKAL